MHASESEWTGGSKLHQLEEAAVLLSSTTLAPIEPTLARAHRRHSAQWPRQPVDRARTPASAQWRRERGAGTSRPTRARTTTRRTPRATATTTRAATSPSAPTTPVTTAEARAAEAHEARGPGDRSALARRAPLSAAATLDCSAQSTAAWAPAAANPDPIWRCVPPLPLLPTKSCEVLRAQKSPG